jgi:hypothetical protein
VRPGAAAMVALALAACHGGLPPTSAPPLAITTETRRVSCFAVELVRQVTFTTSEPFAIEDVVLVAQP